MPFKDDYIIFYKLEGGSGAPIPPLSRASIIFNSS